MVFEKLRTIVITAIPKPRSREGFRKIAETTSTLRKTRFEDAMLSILVTSCFTTTLT